MRTVSRAWQRTVVGSYTPITRVTLCHDYQTSSSPRGELLPLSSGSVHLDGAADIYASARLTFPGELWTDLTPDGSEVYIETGIRYSDASVELVGLGYFRLRLPSQGDASNRGPIDLTADDRMSTIARADLLAPRTYPASTTYGEMAADLVLDVYPEALIDWDDEMENVPIGREVVIDQYRLQALQGVATATAKTMRWDSRGMLTFRTPSLLLGATPAFHVTAGRGGVLAKASREISDAQAVNAVAVRGDGSDGGSVAYGVAYDRDPNSPTRYGGPFGPAPKIITSSLVRTNAQANIVAAAELAQSMGLAHTVKWTSSPRPELEPGDMGVIEHEYGVGRHLIASLDIPLVAGGTQSGITRQQTVTPGGSR